MIITDRTSYEKYWHQDAGRAFDEVLLTPRHLATLRRAVAIGARVLDAEGGKYGTVRRRMEAVYRAVGLALSFRALASRAPLEVPRLQRLFEAPLPFRGGCFAAVYCAEDVILVAERAP